MTTAHFLALMSSWAKGGLAALAQILDVQIQSWPEHHTQDSMSSLGDLRFPGHQRRYALYMGEAVYSKQGSTLPPGVLRLKCSCSCTFPGLNRHSASLLRNQSIQAIGQRNAPTRNWTCFLQSELLVFLQPYRAESEMLPLFCRASATTAASRSYVLAALQTPEIDTSQFLKVQGLCIWYCKSNEWNITRSCTIWLSSFHCVSILRD